MLFSTNPYDFGSYEPRAESEDAARVVTRLYGHASEVIYDAGGEPGEGQGQGRWLMTCAGWRGFGLPHEGCVSIAPLTWERAD